MKLFFKNLLILIFLITAILIFLFFFFGSKGFQDIDEGRQIKLVNSSKDVIYCLLSDNGEYKKPIHNYNIDTIKTKSFNTINCISGITWELLAKNSVGGKIFLYIIPQDSVSKYSMASVFEKSRYSKKISVNIDYLDKNNWTIVYK